MSTIVPPPTDAQDALATMYRDYCHTARIVTARKRHHCAIRDHYPTPCLPIMPGDKYIRSTAFPGHESMPARWEKGARPVSHAVCLSCARNYIGLDDLAQIAEGDA